MSNKPHVSGKIRQQEMGLSQVPCEPKMLVSAMNPKALAAFHLTSLEAGGRRELAVEADLGAPLTVLDVSAYAVPAAAQPLHPDDEALLEVNPRSGTCMLVGAANIYEHGRRKNYSHAWIQEELALVSVRALFCLRIRGQMGLPDSTIVKYYCRITLWLDISSECSGCQSQTEVDPIGHIESIGALLTAGVSD